jgi:hypothetical protein
MPGVITRRRPGVRPCRRRGSRRQEQRLQMARGVLVPERGDRSEGRSHSRVSPADRPRIREEAKSVLVRAILGNALRSRVRRFESCWGRHPTTSINSRLTSRNSHSLSSCGWPSAARMRHEPPSRDALHPLYAPRRSFRARLSLGPSALPIAGYENAASPILSTAETVIFCSVATASRTCRPSGSAWCRLSSPDLGRYGESTSGERVSQTLGALGVSI